MDHLFRICTLSLALVSSPVTAEVAVPFASKLWGLRVISITNPGTSNAVLTARISEVGANEYCERDPGGETVKYGGKLTMGQCVQQLLAREQHKTYTFKANCPKRMIWDGEQWFRLLPADREGSLHWQDVRTGRTLGASGASNHDAHNAQYVMLCPGAETTYY